MRTLLLTSLLFGVFAIPAQISDNIHVDQFGYLPEMSKVAVISDPIEGYNSADSYSPGSTVQLIRVSDNTVVFSAPAAQWNGGATQVSSGDRGWWFDFSSFSIAGTYRLEDPSTGQFSADFEIGDEVYEGVMEAATRMFYYNRCNTPKLATHAGADWSDGTSFFNPGQDADCRFIYDQDNADTEKDLSGGWFDAGDLNKYVTFAESAVHDLLRAYEENPQAFSDDTNIPESGNGIPDILDEVKWELDWLMKMNNSDGSTHIKMGSTDHNMNSSTPPSVNVDPRYYGPTCTSASVSIASMFSLAARVYGGQVGMSAYAQQLEDRAVQSWAYTQDFIDSSTLETSCDDGSIVSGDADRSSEEQMDLAITAAIYLYDLTGESEYNDFVLDHLYETEQMTTGFWGVNKMTLTDALLEYSQMTGADQNAATSIVQSITTAVENNWNGFFGFTDLDLYRNYTPDWTFDWGSNSGKSAYGILNNLIVDMGIVEAAPNEYSQQVAEITHYIHGVNPQGLVYLSNMYEYGADRGVNEIYHQWFSDGSVWDHALTSQYGPAPGYLAGGPNQYFSVPAISPPAGQPLQKAYLDFNDGWPNNSWEISEPAIYYQAAYVRMLANAVSSSSAGCPEDLNADGMVNINDFLVYNSTFGEQCDGCPADIDGNGTVDVSDFLIFNSAFGAVCE